MNPEKPDSPEEEQLASWLAAGDNALAAGSSPEAVDPAGAPPELRPQLKQDLAYIQLLRQALRRPAPATPVLEDAPDTGPSPGLPWTQLGRFQIVRELGRGAFGVVFLAYDPQLGREVALKVPRAEALLTPELRERFRREGRAAAHLDHPNLVPVHEAGEVDSICFIVSAYCFGPTLAEWLKQRTEPVPFDLAATLVVQLAEAVQHAHQHGVLHRDLKPSNVILTGLRAQDSGVREDKNTLASSLTPDPWLLTPAPKITDFGLAKLLAGEPDQAASAGPTRSGAILGTPSYMAPEQAGGKVREVGPAVDIYALGAVLYEVLTGRPPHQGETDLETLLQVRSEEPVSVHRLRPKVPRDLETICLKCLQKEPHKRYASALALAADLRRFLAGQPIMARPVRRAERLWRWCRRNPALASASGLAAPRFSRS